MPFKKVSTKFIPSTEVSKSCLQDHYHVIGGMDALLTQLHSVLFPSLPLVKQYPPRISSIFKSWY